ncbi:MAG: CDP-glucose 4,6-dehydratase, partial [Verrucomicrobiota bacterium]
DCLSGYLLLGAMIALSEKNSKYADAFNFGPGPGANLPVSAIVDQILKIWPGQWEDCSDPNAPHEAQSLNLAIDKSSTVLGWHPVWQTNHAVEKTVQWYHQRHVEKTKDLLDFSLAQIDAYIADARQQKAAWANSVSV